MEIRRKDVAIEGLEQKLYFDFTLDNEEANSAEAIGAIAAGSANAVPPPFGQILSALISGDVAEIKANNRGNGVGANINVTALLEFGVPPVVTLKHYFPL